MPSASNELRTEMQRLFGDPIDDTGPMNHLKAAGYKLTADWHWLPKPNVSSYEDMTKDEYSCLLFLVQEWDMGGLRLPTES